MISPATILFVLSVLAPSFIQAKNDWSVPCVDGSCSWDTGDGKTTAYSSMAIAGTNNLISDITPAAGWDIQGCNPDWASGEHTFQISCASASNQTALCSHLFEGGAEDTIVRLPADCGKGPFARVASIDSQDGTSIARRKAIEEGSQYTVKLDYNFSKIPTSRGKATFAITSTNIPGLPGVSKRDLLQLRKRGRAGALHRRKFSQFQERGFFGDALDSAKDLVGGAADAVGNAVGGAADAVGNAVGGAVDSATDFAGDAVDAVGSAASAVGGAVSDAAGSVGDFVGDTADSVGDFVGDTADSVGGAVSDAADSVGDFVGDAADSVGDFVGDAASAVTSAAGAAATAIGDAVSDANSFDQTLNSGPLTPINFSKEVNLFDQSISCDSGDVSGSASLKIDVAGNVQGTVSFGATIVGTIVPPEISDFSVNADLGGSASATFTIDATVQGQLGTGNIELFKTGLPGLSIPSIVTIGPEFSISGAIDMNLEAEAKMVVTAGWDFPSLKLVFPEDKGSSSGSATVSGTDNPLQLSADPSVDISGTITGHLIPRVDFGIDLFGGVAQASVFIDADTSASVTMEVKASAQIQNDAAASASAAASAPTPAGDSANTPAADGENNAGSDPAGASASSNPKTNDADNAAQDGGSNADPDNLGDGADDQTEDGIQGSGQDDTIEGDSGEDALNDDSQDDTLEDDTSGDDGLGDDTFGDDGLGDDTFGDDDLGDDTFGDDTFGDDASSGSDNSDFDDGSFDNADFGDDAAVTDDGSFDDGSAVADDGSSDFDTGFDDSTSDDSDFSDPNLDDSSLDSDFDGSDSDDSTFNDSSLDSSVDDSSFDDSTFDDTFDDSTTDDPDATDATDNVDSTFVRKRAVSGSASGCITVNGAINVKAGLTGSLEPFITDATTSFDIFSKEVQLFQKCLGGGQAERRAIPKSRKLARVIVPRAGDSSGLQCPAKIVNALSSLI